MQPSQAESNGHGQHSPHFSVAFSAMQRDEMIGGINRSEEPWHPQEAMICSRSGPTRISQVPTVSMTRDPITDSEGGLILVVEMPVFFQKEAGLDPRWGPFISIFPQETSPTVILRQSLSKGTKDETDASANLGSNSR